MRPWRRNHGDEIVNFKIVPSPYTYPSRLSYFFLVTSANPASSPVSVEAVAELLQRLQRLLHLLQRLLPLYVPFKLFAVTSANPTGYFLWEKSDDPAAHRLRVPPPLHHEVFLYIYRPLPSCLSFAFHVLTTVVQIILPKPLPDSGTLSLC